jgi:hypothetical protein
MSAKTGGSALLFSFFASSPFVPEDIIVEESTIRAKPKSQI